MNACSLKCKCNVMKCKNRSTPDSSLSEVSDSFQHCDTKYWFNFLLIVSFCQSLWFSKFFFGKFCTGGICKIQHFLPHPIFLHMVFSEAFYSLLAGVHCSIGFLKKKITSATEVMFLVLLVGQLVNWLVRRTTQKVKNRFLLIFYHKCIPLLDKPRLKLDLRKTPLLTQYPPLCVQYSCLYFLPSRILQLFNLIGLLPTEVPHSIPPLPSVPCNYAVPTHTNLLIILQPSQVGLIFCDSPDSPLV